MLKGIIFDMDGLIFDSEMIYYEGSQQVADQMGIPYTKELYLQFLGVSDEEVWAGYHALFDEEFGAPYVEEFIERAYQTGLELFAAGRAAIKPGVTEVLAFLTEANISWVIASSNQRFLIDQLLAVSGLAEAFPLIVSVEDVTRAKPDPEIFQVALERLGITQNEALVLEDSQNGVLAANAAGIPVIMVPDLLQPDPELTAKTELVLPSLVELPRYLRQRIQQN